MFLSGVVRLTCNLCKRKTIVGNNVENFITNRSKFYKNKSSFGTFLGKTMKSYRHYCHEAKSFTFTATHIHL